MSARRPLLLVAGAVSLSCGGPSAPAAPSRVAATLPWIHDDAPRAIAEAQRTGKPLLVEFGAAWCKACVSMQAYAFQEPSLVAALADRAVWLAIDLDNPANEAFVAAHTHRHYPTFTVLDGAGERSWSGYFQADEFVSIFRVALLGDAAAIAQQERRFNEDYRGCVEAAEGPASPWVGLVKATAASTCAHALLGKGASTPNAGDVRPRLEGAIAAALAAPPIADGPILLHEAYEALHESTDRGDRAPIAAAWRRHAERLPAVPRAHALRVTGAPEAAATLLAAHLREAPSDGDAYAALADAALDLGRYPDGLAASDRALALLSGPSRLPVYWTKAYLAHRAGDDRRAEQILDEAKASAAKLPLSRGGAELANRLARLRDGGF